MIEINLLPKELQWKRFSFKLDKKLVVLLSAGGVIILAMAAYSFILQAAQISTYQKNIANYRAEAEQFADEIKKIDDINQKKDQIVARMTAIELLDRNRGYWVGLMEDLIRRVPEYLWITSVREATAGTVASTSAPSSTAPAAAARSSIEGFAFSLNAVATFIVRLKKSDIFTNIEISSVNLEETQNSRAYAFKLNCDFNAPTPAVPTETAQAPGKAGSQF